MKRGVVNHVRCLEVGSCGRVFGGTRSHRGREAPCYRRILGDRSGQAWVVEELYDVASEDVGGLLGFTKPSGTIKGMVPNGGSDRQRSG